MAAADLGRRVVLAHLPMQDALLYQREGLQVKMMAEEEVALLKQEVEAMRAAMEQEREAYSSATQQLHSLVMAARIHCSLGL